MEHTIGPWHFDGHGVNSPTGERIAKVQHSNNYEEGPDGKPRRNARFDADSSLIAAAPDLLMACREALVYFLAEPFSSEHIRKILRNAVAKAKGTTTGS